MLNEHALVRPPSRLRDVVIPHAHYNSRGKRYCRNTQIIDTCIVFPAWHIRSHAAFVLSFLAIVALGVFYEWLRAFSRRFDRSVVRALAAQRGKSTAVSPPPSPGGAADEDEGLLTGRPAPFSKQSLYVFDLRTSDGVQKEGKTDVAHAILLLL